MKEKVVLWHADGLGSRKAFDLVVRRGVELDEEEKKFVNHLYHVDCKVAHEFLEKFPEYELLGSEDLLHTKGVNAGLLETLESLREKGWQWIDAVSLGLEEDK